MTPAACFWIAFSSHENCETAFRLGIWGLRPGQESRWDRISENKDLVFFYVGKPVGGVVGCAVVLRKFRDNKLVWPEEYGKGRAIWPLRFEFSLSFRIDPSFWRQQKIRVPELKRFWQGGFQELPMPVAQKLLRLFPPTAGTQDNQVLQSSVGAPTEVSSQNPHDQGKLWLVEIGRMQTFFADTEYPLQTKRVDVVWRRVELAVPSHVFEVQVGGNLTDALGKLKQAYDLWNSRIFLVGAQEHQRPFDQVIAGSFREIARRVRFIELAEVEQLYHRKQAFRELENRLGILS